MSKSEKSGDVKVYNCIVRLGGSLLHTVPKVKISGEEVRLLKTLHGDDSIAELKEIGELADWSREDELHHLADAYSTDPERKEGRKLVEKVFSVTLDNFDRWLAAKEAQEDQRTEETEALRQLEARADSRGTFVRSNAKT